MTAQERCGICGAALPSPGAECPACLLNLALEDNVQEQAAREAAAGTREAETDLGTGIGPYRLERILGEGGMGVVYLAGQEKPIQRQVALKVIRIGMDSREVLGRFEVERQTLALMDHPNIARVIDAGATRQGRPFFVMEYVPGPPITEYCDRARMAVTERIDLFLAVCDAVQHAHLKGIIHRDLKPSNVLVSELDGRPVPKVIDFGLAKATRQRLTERTAFTRFGRLIGTPEYMSPEQARLTDAEVDTRTDLYSLGILLYEMLAGAPPLDAAELRKAGLEGLLRQIRDAPSPRPSVRINSLGDAATEIADNRRTDRATLMRRLQGDLDWVVMKAIEKDRSRRYATVQELAAELRRYLNQEPVEAGPPGPLYRAGKFVRRHRAGVLAAGAVATALILGLAGTSAGWVRALRAERRAVDAEGQARDEAAAARQVSDFLVSLFEAASPATRPPSEITAPEILGRGAERIRTELAGRPLQQARMMETIARVYQTLTMYDEARALADEVLEIRQRELPPDHLDISATLLLIGIIEQPRGNYAESERFIREAMERQEPRMEEGDPRWIPYLGALVALTTQQQRYSEAEPLARRILALEEENGRDPTRVALARESLGVVLIAFGRYDEAEPLVVEALAATRSAKGEHVAVARMANRVALLRQRQGRYAEAREMLELVVETQERILGRRHPNLANSLNDLAINHAIQGDFAAAEPLFERVVALYEDLYSPAHPMVGSMLVNLGNIRRDLGRYDDAEATYLRSLEILEESTGPETPSVATACGNLGGLYAQLGRREEAEALHRRALAIREKVLGPEHPETAFSLDNVAASLVDRGLLDEAEPLLLRSLALRESVLGADHADVARSLHGLGELYRAQGREAEAVDMLQRAVRIRERRLGADHPKLADSLSTLASAHADGGRADEAEKLFKRAIAIMEAKYPTDHPEIREMLESYASLLRATGRPGEAERLEARAAAIRSS